MTKTKKQTTKKEEKEEKIELDFPNCFLSSTDVMGINPKANVFEYNKNGIKIVFESISLKDAITIYDELEAKSKPHIFSGVM